MSLVGWLRGVKDQRIGRDEQEVADAKVTEAKQEAELKAAVNRPDDAALSDELRGGFF